MKYYLREIVFIFMYVIFSIITTFAITYVEDNTLRWILYIADIAMYTSLIAIYFWGIGKRAVEVRNSNDKKREIIIKTGEDIPLNKAEEYKPYKGLVIAFMVILPLIVCTVINLILTSIDPTLTGAGKVESVIYFMFYAPIAELAGGETTPIWVYYALLYVIPYVMTNIGLFYYLGAKKAERQVDKIQEIKKRLHGEQN